MPAESVQEKHNSPLAVAWRRLEANLKVSSKLTKTAKQKEDAVMLEWSQFHDFEGADQYSARWAERVRVRREETTNVDEFLKQRANRRAREASETLGKEEAVRKIQAKLEKARADEEAASLRRRVNEKGGRDDRCQSHQRSDSSRRYDRCQSRQQNDPGHRDDRCRNRPQGDSGRRETPQKEAAATGERQVTKDALENRQPGEPRRPRLCFVCGHPNVRNPVTCPNSGKAPHDGVTSFYYSNR